MGLFSSTRRRYYHTQQSILINSEYMPDPISTYAASALASNSDVGAQVISALQSGSGNALRKYYQYATLRFKNRNYEWTFKSVVGNTSTINYINQDDFNVLFKPKLINRIIDITSVYDIGSPYHYAQMQSRYGLDIFHTNYNDISINLDTITQVENSYNSWVIGITKINNKEVSVIIRDPLDTNLIPDSNDYFIIETYSYKPVSAKGITYITASTEPVITETTTPLVLTDDEAEQQGYAYSDDDISPNRVFQYETTNYYDTDENETQPEDISNDDGTIEDNPTKDDDNKDSEDTFNFKDDETITAHYYTLDSRTPIYDTEIDSTTGLPVQVIVNYNNNYTLIKVAKTYKYDTENFAWLLPTGITNLSGLDQLFKSDETNTGSSSNITPQETFKLYPYIPIREWYGHTIDTFDLTNSTLLKLYKELAKQDKDEIEADTEAQREYADKKKDDSRNKTVRELNKERQQKRHIKINDNIYLPIKEMSVNAIRRHLSRMGEYLALNPVENAASLAADDKWSSYRQALIVPAVALNTNNNDVVHYWIAFWKNMYHVLDNDGGYNRWVENINTSAGLVNVPFNVLEWTNLSGRVSGGISFAFIRKFKMKGHIKTIRHNRSVVEIRRGKPTTITSIVDLKTVIEPPREFAADTYYTSNSGKQYNIGGGDDNFTGSIDKRFYNGVFRVNNPSGVSENSSSNLDALGTYCYTFFAEQAGKDEVSVIAVAGLAGKIVLDGTAMWGQAWYDLQLQYARNKAKYIDKKSDYVAQYQRSSGGKKNRTYKQVNSFFEVPIDYNALRKMSAVELERFSQRSTMLNCYVYNKQKYKKSHLGGIFKIIGIIVSIVIAYFCPPAGGWTASAVLAATATAVVVNIAISVAVKVILMPLFKILGVKGVLLVVIAAIIAIIASYAGAGTDSISSSLPLASSTVSTNVASEVAKNTIQTTVSNFFQQVTQNFMQQITSMSLGDLAKPVFSAGMEYLNNSYATDLQKIQNDLTKQQNEYLNQMNDLEDAEADFKSNAAPYDFKTVMSALRSRFKLVEPDNFIAGLLDTTDATATYDYLSYFLENKLLLDPTMFDSVESLNFSLNQSKY